MGFNHLDDPQSENKRKGVCPLFFSQSAKEKEKQQKEKGVCPLFIESNRISIVEFDSLFEAESRAAGHAIEGRKVLALLAGDVRPEMVAALKTRKANFKVGCITNNVKLVKGTAMPQTSEKKVQMMEIIAFFDEVIESSVEEVRKPDPEIYQIALERMDVKAQECVFLDDLGINLRPTKALGMKTIKVLSARQALEELEQHTGLKFSNPLEK